MTWEGLTPPYATLVVDPPWHYDERVVGFDKTVPMPYSTMSVAEIADLPVYDLADVGAHLFMWTTNRYLWAAKDIAYGWGFEPSTVLVWCKPADRVSPGGGAFFSTTEFVIYARRTKTKRRGVHVGAQITAAREAAGMSRADLHRAVRGDQPTGIVYRWEADESVPNERDWQRIQDALPDLASVERPPVELVERERVPTTWFTWPRGPHSEKPAAFLDVVESMAPGPYVELFARQPRLGWDHWGYGYESESA